MTTLDTTLTTVQDAYAARRPLSRAAFTRAQLSLPGGETRSITHYSPFPAAIARGHAAVLTDADGHEYIDLVNNYTSLVHGNAHPAIVEAIKSTADAGTAFAAVHPAQLDLAEAIIGRLASVQKVRFTNSGSEASSLAARIARRATGRRVLVMAAEGYHGGIPPFADADEPDVVRIPYGDADALRAAVSTEVAAVFLEPFLGAGGVVPAPEGYLAAAQEAAHAAGALLVLDEVQSLRNDPRGAQGTLGLAPDLTLMAKIIGGGLAIGAVGGRADLMDITAATRTGHLHHSGTFNGHAAAAAAGVASLRLLDADAIRSLNAAASALADAVTRASLGTAYVTRAGSIMNVHPVVDGLVITDPGAHPAWRTALHLSLMDHGIYTTPRGMINLSTAVTDAQLTRAAEAYGEALAIVGSAA
ncbi:aminotransferase class III-fold pyridoxal phosphate-dependent enzyme [Demequina zhanjiangensis]|uniref:Aminotransferase class III-fold pyridoxal phosphate-dependent enzyme n=1 Tax=Demequina zhanjiangensis TaxID=3051659 RepID=A0ABT8G1A3_9MICO|nr:aminotransferase class III-fold pyridoxal phosphate-dependent enzyme [Demequina sp. SYSU T00b26]MDN4472915.1 aminotransferase class III-fold pyridoxal phosphate-dependent enzyme [Demequina sp. SYSU T00b26]